MSINVTLICPIYSSLVSLKSIIREIDFLEKNYLTKFELVIINDASPILKKKDISELINKLPKEISFQYTQLEKNLGVGAVRNIGISLANSIKYIGFVDDDDIPNLKNIIDLGLSSDLDIIISPYIRITKFKNFFKEYNSNLTFFYFFLKGYLKTVAWNKLYKLIYIKKVSAKFSELRLFEDELFFLKILFSKNKKIFSIVDSAFVKVIKRKNSRSRSFTHKEIYTYFQVQNENIKFVSKQSFLVKISWLLFFFPKSLISVVVSYLRSIYFRRIISRLIR